MADKKIENIDEIIFQTTIDIEKLKTWLHDDDKKLPVYSYLSLYEACGIVDAIKAYVVDHPDFQPVCFDNIQCNAYTGAVLKNFLKEQWQCYSLKLNGDNQVEWNTKTYPAGVRHYKRSLPKKVESSLTLDYGNYCPGWDDDLEDNVLVFKVWNKKELDDSGAEIADAELVS